jgi:DNA-binding CsgD family transcriptional regulator
MLACGEYREGVSKVSLRSVVCVSNRVTGLSWSQPEESAVPACVLRVVGSLGCAGLLLDCRRRVLFLNELARNCIGDGLTLRGERLAAKDDESDARLQHLIGLALCSSASPPPITPVVIQRACKRPLLVRVFRLEESAKPAVSSASLLIVAFDPEMCPEPPADMLTQMFGLTPAEARVAIGIVCGKNLAEIAGDLGVKIGTVRAYSKSVFWKTQTRGQAELAGLLTRLAFGNPYRLRLSSGQACRP